jgi:acyl-CoA reductase-like NAD-dependent aldehyde dehydrogenase
VAREFPFILAGKPGRSAAPLHVLNPYDDSPVATTWLAGEAELEESARSAVAAAPVMRALAAYERGAILSSATRLKR